MVGGLIVILLRISVPLVLQCDIVAWLFLWVASSRYIAAEASSTGFTFSTDARLTLFGKCESIAIMALMLRASLCGEHNLRKRWTLETGGDFKQILTLSVNDDKLGRRRLCSLETNIEHYRIL